ncbi:hypothetical protein LSH36_491g05053 [Paralvinella palmiformis]|uniref:Peptidase M13 N-terminal domain-containing protein n=1 Tax=Paralvinella palmiformis TaxID=53620 RepID=A0AAD9MYP8_9ANNE|nr:hypothetical protein LSH36_491g05053 [Paralvinella palmiformis]
MATYIEVRPDDEEESDTAQPSTSSCSGTSKVKRSDSYNNKSGDPGQEPYGARTELDAPDVRDAQSTSRTSSRKSKHHRNHSGSRHQHNNNHVPTPAPNPQPEYKEPEHGTEAEVREYDFCMKTPMSDGHIIDLRGREVLFAIGVFFFLSVSIGLIVVLASNKVKEMNQAKLDNGKTATCYSKECLSRAADMLAKMDGSVKPCTDFWRFSCGGWLDRADIPPLENSWGVSKELKKRIEGDILALLESDVRRNRNTSAERKMKVVYRSCMDVDRIDEFGDWNMKMKPGVWSFQSFLKELHHEYYIQVFFTMFVHPDDKGGGNLLQVNDHCSRPKMR